jgi:hypothetical protein
MDAAVPNKPRFYVTRLFITHAKRMLFYSRKAEKYKIYGLRSRGPKLTLPKSDDSKIVSGFEFLTKQGISASFWVKISKQTFPCSSIFSNP